MKVYCVVQEYHDDCKVYAWITNHIMDKLPEEKIVEYNNKDVWHTYFDNKEEAIAFCDEIINA